MMATGLNLLFDFQSFSLQSLAGPGSERILNCTVEGTAIALLSWILLRALGRQNSGTRFAVWFSALLGIAALPLLGHHPVLTKRPEITLPASWALDLFAGWALIASAGLIRIGFGFWRLRQVRKSCVPVDLTTLDPLLRKTLEEFDSPRRPTLCVSHQLRVPTAIGFIKPQVAIPSWAMKELSLPELNTILLHELAHLRRWDDWTNLVQKIVATLLFFHPAVWWIDGKLALEREMACDDLVLAKTASPRVYAECLVSLAEKSFLRRGVALAQAAVNRVRHVSLRVAQILDEKRPGAIRIWKPAPVMLAGISIACLIGFSGAPNLVSFENTSAGSAGPATTILSSSLSENSQAARIGADVVPAKYVVEPASKTASPFTASLAAKTKVNDRKPAVVPAKVRHLRAQPPRLVRSSLTEDGIAPRTLIFVWQTEMRRVQVVPASFMRDGQPAASDAMLWNLFLWQVRVIGMDRNVIEMEQGIIVNSI